MPLFGRKFSPKTTSPRKSPSISRLNRNLDPLQSRAEFDVDYGPVKMKLGDQEALFQDGKWITGSSTPPASPQTILQLKLQNEQLREENNLLKLKVGILLDMLAETTAEVHLQEIEIEEMKTKLK